MKEDFAAELRKVIFNIHNLKAKTWYLQEAMVERHLPFQPENSYFVIPGDYWPEGEDW